MLLILFAAIFYPSYTYPPEHYNLLAKRCEESRNPGRGNINNEKVFIAATLYDKNGVLVGGNWGTAIRELVNLLGPENVHLSVYENNADEMAKKSLERLQKDLACNVSLVTEELPPGAVPSVVVPSGERRTKRIAFLAEVRNRALRPLRDSEIRFDKLLYVNDVIFNPVDAVQLLFSTNIGSDGKTQYTAACAVDFINPFKFYDRFATRDFDGYELGIPFFPFFTDAGSSISRNDILAQKDSVRVSACWGGMTAFEASWFQERSMEQSSDEGIHSGSVVAGLQLWPVHFRYELDPFWDASECCLIHADLSYLQRGTNNTADPRIYTNPYVRVAYDPTTLSWLPYTRRVERLYPHIHNILNHLVGLPAKNLRMFERPGDEVTEQVWRFDQDDENSKSHESTQASRSGAYFQIDRIAPPGRFCGRRALVVLKDDPKEEEKNWIKLPIPPLPVKLIDKAEILARAGRRI
ncbi:hypothetical protein PVAG01_02036 [Phlyctema vagabunda]|uniref:Glycosyltransferase family 69 protein n=1 Tax=Phlyctema vagabunda TaxID=108571 RepID=A0ABR4PZA2_9HELO